MTLVKHPKIEICKTCRTHELPIISKMNTMIDLEAMGLPPPELAHLNLEEQLENKLHVHCRLKVLDGQVFKTGVV